MKTRENNIFFNLVKNETSLTEVFCNFMQYKTIRDTFLNFVVLKSNNVNFDNDLVKYDNFYTEKDFGFSKEDKTKKLGRGDLVLNYKGLDYIFELKIEINTRLTENQPKNYLKYLKEQNEDNFKKRLFFILPKGYWHKEEIKSNIINEHILYWEDILKEIKNKELHKINPLVNDFCNILDYRWFYFQEINFNKKEIELIIHKKETAMNNQIVPKMMRKLFSIVNGASEKIKYLKKEDEQYEDWFGYVVDNKKYNIHENYIVWFGVDYELWEKEGYPLTIQVDSENDEEIKKILKLTINNNKIKKFEYQKDEDEEGSIIYYFELDNKLFEQNKDNIIEKFRDKILEVIESLKTL